jgi:hypothetical protein
MPSVLKALAIARKLGWQFDIMLTSFFLSRRSLKPAAAWQCRSDNIAGILEPGKYADLALLEQDPTAVDPMTIEKIRVSETWLAGKVRHGA